MIWLLYDTNSNQILNLASPFIYLLLNIIIERNLWKIGEIFSIFYHYETSMRSSAMKKKQIFELKQNIDHERRRNCFYDIQFPQFISSESSRKIITNYIRRSGRLLGGSTLLASGISLGALLDKFCSLSGAQLRFSEETFDLFWWKREETWCEFEFRWKLSFT
jgi:hypothetical protein